MSTSRDVRRARPGTATAAGLPVELIKLRGHDHDSYHGTAKRVNRDSCEFLSRHRLDGEPIYEERVFAAG